LRGNPHSDSTRWSSCSSFWVCKDMRTQGKTIFIEVLPTFEYDATLTDIGELGDKLSQGKYTMFGWLNHLREKSWWDYYKEEEFINIAYGLFT
jgi:hypothetical protein